MSRLFKPEKLFFPRDFVKPVISDKTFLEIGAGRGLHAVQFAKANPSSQLMAIERTRVKFEDFAKRAEHHKLSNLIPIHADAIPWVVHGIPAASLDGVFLLYPNPEPKNAAQRWLNMPFFEFLLSRLKPAKKIIVATNIQSYFEEAHQQAEEHWKLEVDNFKIDPSSNRTHFEIKYLARGETCYQLELTKPKGYATRFDHWNSKT